MPLFRSITLIFALLLQALPASVVALAESGVELAAHACPMPCCQLAEAMANAEAQNCGCIEEAPSVPSKPAPYHSPSGILRDLVPQTAWIPLVENFLTGAFAAAPPPVVPPVDDLSQSTTTPHVRLSVLFCSLLTRARVFHRRIVPAHRGPVSAKQSSHHTPCDVPSGFAR